MLLRIGPTLRVGKQSAFRDEALACGASIPNRQVSK
jgi:hypothetical protein